MTLSLEEWDQKVGRHLHLIEVGADMCARHAEQMFLRPNFASIAEADLECADKILTAALEKIRYAQSIYREKPRDA